MDGLFESILSSANAPRRAEPASKKRIKTDWDDIEGQGTFRDKSVDRWTTRDMFLFYLDTFRNVIGQEFFTSLAPAQQQILMLQDSLAEYMGMRPTQQQTRDYIEWFLTSNASKLLDKYNCFKMKFMRYPSEIERYLSLKGIEQKVQVSYKTKEELILSEEMMRSVYSVNIENFVLKYGLVLSVIWLMRKHRIPEQEAISTVTAYALSISQKGQYNDLISATEKHNPYPIWCQFAGFRSMLADLTERTGEFFDIVDGRFLQDVKTFDFLDTKE